MSAVRASAGTGKTHVLVETYVGLLAGVDRDEPLRPSNILALTFTDRAAAEMRERILRRLRSISAPGPERDAWLEAVAGRARLTQADVLARLEPQVLAAPIGTFHSFCGRLLREYAADAGLPLAPTILDAAASAQLLSESALEAVQAALTTPDRDPVLALTETLGLGPRRGLLQALVSVPAKLGERGLSLSELRLHDGAPEAPLLRVALDLPPLLHALAAAATTPAARSRVRELLDHAATLAHAPDEDALLHALAAVDALCRGNWGGSALSDLRRRVRGAVGAAASAWAAREARDAGLRLASLATATGEAYRRRKQEMAAVDFTDLLVGARDLLRRQPLVRQRVATRFSALLVDEAQDTSPVQAELLVLLSDERAVPPREVAHAQFPPGKLLLVGDRKQSIYGFRGADLALFDDALNALQRSGGEEVVLQHSRRSSATLVRLINELSEAALGPAFTGEDRLLPLAEGGRKQPGRWVRAEVPATANSRERREAEAAALAAQVACLLEEPDAPRPSQVAVLLRARTHAEVYRHALSRVGIPARIGRGGSLLDRPEVQDALALLTLVADREDSAALARVLRSPWVMLRDEVLVDACFKREPPRLDVSALLSLREGDALPPLEDAERLRLQRLESAVTPLWPQAGRLDAAQALNHLLESLDGWATLELHEDGSARVANLRALSSRLRGHPVREAVRRVEEARRAGAVWPLGTPEGVVEQVTLLTIHEAKGLEFRVVALADLCGSAQSRGADVEWHPRLGLAVRTPDHASGLLEACGAFTPVEEVREALQVDAEAESQRLLYVGLTRAKDLLLFSGEPGQGAAPRAGTFAGRLYSTLERLVRDGLVQVWTPPPGATVRAPPVDIPVLALAAEPPDALEPFLHRAPVAAQALADALVCPRRFALLWREPALEEPAPEGDPVPPELSDAVRRAVVLVEPGPSDAEALRRALLAVNLEEQLLPPAAWAAVHAEAHSFWTSPLGQALRQVPADALWRQVPGVLDLGGQAVTGTPDLVVAGTGTEPWMVVSCQRTAEVQPRASHQALLDLWALLVARATGAAAVTTVLACLRDPPVRLHVRTLDAPALAALRSAALDAVERLPSLRQRPEPEGLPRAACEQRGCGFVRRCHP